MTDEMSSVEEMLARFICADAQDMSLMELSKFGMSKNVNVGMEVDAGARFAFEPQFPTVAYTVDLSESRDIATDARLSHMRKNAHKQWDVKEHLRGVHEFRMDGFHVKLEAAA